MNKPKSPDLSHRLAENPRSSDLIAEHDFEIYTDGAGFEDGYGGAAVIGMSSKFNKFFHRVSASTGVSVDRAEFQALLLGLHGIIDDLNWWGESALERLKVRPLRVFWLSDRESLVLSVRGKYKREKQPDLWAAYGWYSQYLHVSAYFEHRDTNAWQKITDQLASEARMIIKDYDTVIKDQKIV